MKKKLKKITGAVVPLGALRTEKNKIIGEFSSLLNLIPFCKKSGIELIQLLPINDSGTQSSPYSGLSAFALHPLYISITEISFFKKLYSENSSFSKAYDQYQKKYSIPVSKIKNRFNYSGILNDKTELLRTLFLSEFSDADDDLGFDEEFSEWIEKNAWVKSYSVFKSLKEKHLQSSWKTWPKDDQTADFEKICNTEDENLRSQNIFYAWCQYIAFKQFYAVSQKIKDEGIILKGDMPILMNEDSCDAWENSSVFNHNLRAGSPPDGDNPCGQNWGFPTYNWNQLKKDNYKWWKNRLINASQFYSAYRLDHILGFFRIWAVPENDTTAILGHAEPNIPISNDELVDIGFDKNRIHWLSEPHIPTGLIEDITWNHEVAHKVLNVFAEQLGNEELWNFKKSILGDKEIYSADLSSFCDKDAENRIKEKLSQAWNDRCIIQLKKDCFVPSWLYVNSTAWKSLNSEEKQKLQNLFAEKDDKQNELWEDSALNILSSLTSSTEMIPCGEDLGVGLPCVPPVMEKTNILGLRVVRWCRKWSESDQPFIPMEKYDQLSITTTSVHDSSTIRQWWAEEKDSVKAFIKSVPKVFGIKEDDKLFDSKISLLAEEDFSPEKAKAILTVAAESQSVWCVHPLQDFLYLEKKYYLDESSNERINIPGTVTDFNWTYMLPIYVDELVENKKLCSSISEICKIHKGGSK